MLAQAQNSPVNFREAMFYRKLDNKKVVCELCPRSCVISSGKRGFCRNRENVDGKLYSVVYNRPVSIGIEPIEKAPFYHFMPGAMRLTLATVGCNQHCKYCQNWEISQRSVEEVENYYLSPEDIIKLAQEKKVKIICFTYTEPIVFYEYMYDIAKLARKEGLKSVVVTGGYINPKPLHELTKVVDAIKIDLKGFNEKFYNEVCNSELAPVLEAIKIVKQSNVHLEIVNLVVPTLNDDTNEIKAMCLWIKENIGSEVPIHFSRFFPQYKLQKLPPTPITTLERSAQIAKQVGLKYVYLGNVFGHELENTYCPQCHKLLIKRQGYSILENNILKGQCKFCGEKIYGVF
ncbi:MAG: AmmeMemoRadiSam system radical SAM enzyme [candidate division WOR-3 bacterium]|nr:AmmeMemoRadiSam system radical SAM enzyme [candidate division WOR-3 bacterium]MDW7987131.1 AmmeMemoRadiSam system radical SAM enzyme [candidate division WOR-3 bacterium]